MYGTTCTYQVRTIPTKANVYISDAPIIYINGGFHVVGGLIDDYTSSLIVRLDATTKEWLIILI